MHTGRAHPPKRSRTGAGLHEAGGPRKPSGPAPALGPLRSGGCHPFRLYRPRSTAVVPAFISLRSPPAAGAPLPIKAAVPAVVPGILVPGIGASVRPVVRLVRWVPASIPPPASSRPTIVPHVRVLLALPAIAAEPDVILPICVPVGRTSPSVPFIPVIASVARPPYATTPFGRVRPVVPGTRPLPTTCHDSPSVMKSIAMPHEAPPEFRWGPRLLLVGCRPHRLAAERTRSAAWLHRSRACSISLETS
jgi:hypothetical protein